MIFLLELEIYGVAVQIIHQNSKKWLLSKKDFLSGDVFEAALIIFSSYGYGVNASEAVEKIATDEKDYHKRSLCCT